MMMGDLNADCGYVPQYRWAEIALKSDPSCHWLIGDEADTTVSNTHCAYDRYVFVLSIADNLLSQDDCNFLKYNIKAIVWAFTNTYGIKGITVFKIFIWGGISSDIWSEI